MRGGLFDFALSRRIRGGNAAYQGGKEDEAENVDKAYSQSVEDWAWHRAEADARTRSDEGVYES